jgi:3-deoxy-D-manno-octulosonic-acid transferase
MSLSLLSFFSQCLSVLGSAITPLVLLLSTSEKSQVFFLERTKKHWLSQIQNALDEFEKSAQNLKQNSQRPVYWVHVASAGELEQIIPVLRSLHERCKVVFFVTYFSPSAKPFLKNCPGVLTATSLPWEDKKLFVHAIQRLQIKRLILVRYDFWPAFISAFQSSSVPICVLAATLQKARSPLPLGVQKKLRAFWLTLCDAIFLVHAKERKTLIAEGLLPEKIFVAGDAKWHRAKERAALVKAKSLSKAIQTLAQAMTFARSQSSDQFGYPVVVFGSPHQEELQVLEKVLRKSIMHQSRRCFFVVAPHEVDEKTLSGIENRLQIGNTRLFRLSQSESPQWRESLQNTKESTIILLDSFGYLAEAYGIADLAVIGGGFDGQLHNVLEPAAIPVATLFGNRATRASEAQTLLTGNAALGFTSPEMLFQFLDRWVTLSEGDAEFGNMFRTLANLRKNAESLFSSLPDTSEVVCQALASKDALEIS